MMNNEKGQALLLVLVALGIGSLVITPFIGHASSSLIGSRIYGEAISEGYSADAGIEHAIWNLVEGSLVAQVPSPGDSTTYQLSETVNDIAPSITVTKMGSSGTIYALRGGTNKDFWGYDIQSNTWTSMADAPETVTDGGAFTNGGNYFYSLRGGNNKDFWRYDSTTNTWSTSVADVPEKVKAGGALTYDGSYIYALRGGIKKDFWRYDIQSNTWSSMADAPDTVQVGGALAYDGSYIYAFRGGNNKDFWRYDIQSNTWSSMADAPETVRIGGALANKIDANYEIVSTAGDSTIRAGVRIVDGTVSILSWQVE